MSIIQNYYAIKPIDAFVYAEYLLENQKDTDLLPCQIIGLCVYKNETITFLIMLDDGEVFAYIPFHYLIHKESTEKQYALNDLIPINSPSYNISINPIETLEGDVSVYMKNHHVWLSGQYICTIDYYEDNELFNLIKLENGQFAMIPFHKMKFKSLSTIQKSFKNYKKQRNTYIL